MYETGTIVRHNLDFSALQDRRAHAKGTPIALTGQTVEVRGVPEKLAAHEAWNKYDPRRESYGTPHTAIDDLWVRYRSWDEWTGDLHAFNTEHTSVWYDVADDVPELKEIVQDVLDTLGPTELGGVLITRIPPGEGIAPHSDAGWHAEYYYDKYAVQLLGNSDQGFCFEGHCVSAEPGEVYWFNNQEKHWVYNDSNEDRMTMIICVRPTEK